MGNDKKMTPEEKARQNVETMIKRCGMIYRHFAETLVDELGEEKGKELIAKAIERYGKETGEKVKEEVINQGKERTVTNYLSDLPEYGWEAQEVERKEGEKQVFDIVRCPLAEYWQEKEMDPQLARLYCGIDQAKYRAYNPEIKCDHAKNMLDGDDRCRLVIEKD